jgi:hypothetical protein
MDDLIEHIALELESTSFWRDQKAAEFPDDKQRNEEAAQLLQRLADNVRAMAGSELALELQKANEELGRVSADFYKLNNRRGPVPQSHWFRPLPEQRLGIFGALARYLPAMHCHRL